MDRADPVGESAGGGQDAHLVGAERVQHDVEILVRLEAAGRAVKPPGNRMAEHLVGLRADEDGARLQAVVLECQHTLVDEGEDAVGGGGRLGNGHAFGAAQEMRR